MWGNGSACVLGGGACSRQSRMRNPARPRRNERRSRYTVSSAKGSRSFSTVALREHPASVATSHDHTSEAVNVWRGNTSARNKQKVRPQPPRWPRSEQNTRWPRNAWPFTAKGSLPKERLWRFNAPRQPQCGQGDCLREKAVSSTPGHHAQSEKANGTSDFAARAVRDRSSFLWRPFRRRSSVEQDQGKAEAALDGTLPALRLHSNPKLRGQCDTITALPTTALLDVTAIRRTSNSKWMSCSPQDKSRTT